MWQNSDARAGGSFAGDHAILDAIAVGHYADPDKNVFVAEPGHLKASI